MMSDNYLLVRTHSHVNHWGETTAFNTSAAVMPSLLKAKEMLDRHVSDLKTHGFMIEEVGVYTFIASKSNYIWDPFYGSYKALHIKLFIARSL